jgi:hypothetical protein
MKHTKDLNWLSAPAFLMILGLIALNAKKPGQQNGQPEKMKKGTTTISVK